MKNCLKIYGTPRLNVVIQDYEDGGLCMTDLDLCIKALRVKQIQKYLKCETDAIWKNLLKIYAK